MSPPSPAFPVSLLEKEEEFIAEFVILISPPALKVIAPPFPALPTEDEEEELRVGSVKNSILLLERLSYIEISPPASRVIAPPSAGFSMEDEEESSPNMAISPPALINMLPALPIAPS